MKFKVLFLLFLTTSCIDVCVQLTTYESCIGFDGEQCRWYGEYCRRSNNYLLGCDANLGIKLCVKQFGTLDGIVAECIFDNFCHKIYDKNAIHCTDKLSKSGCLSITNQNEFCKWEDGQCKNLSTNELSNIDTTFDQMELSASVCGQINGYLIIHNSILWNLINFIPDLYTEAENLVKIEAEIEVTIITNYDESAQLQDNYVDSSGNFLWYELTTLSTISNGRINDYTRYGCIAQEILTDSRFQMLFRADDLIRGVNHVYCSYLSTLSGYYIFINNECQKITELQLKDQDYIENLGIQCSQLSRIPCQRYLNKNEICEANKETEFGCTVLKQTNDLEQCDANVGLATHYYCSKKNRECYLDVSSVNAQCSFVCNVQSETNCLNNTGCKWLLKSNAQIGTDYKFFPCAPIDGCNQIGLSKSYCQRMATNCYWNETETKCYSIDQIKEYKCTDCNSIYCCSSVIQYDQYCIWQNNSCLNIKDQNLFSHYLSFPTNVIMNKNLCVYQRGQFNYYDVITRTCKTDSFNQNQFCLNYDVNGLDVDYVECNNPPNDTVNLEGCLALINSFTKWDYFTQKCLYVVNMNKPCNEMKLVNPNVCKYAVVEDGYLCLYNIDTLNCYSIKQDDIQLTCDTPGIDEEKCISLSEQSCQWLDNQCSKIQPYEIQQRFCYGLMKVSASVCIYPLNQEIQCQYDQDANGCSVIYSATIECNQYSNKYACLKSQQLCYFNNVLNQCQNSSDLLNIIKCDTEYISKTTCLSITTPGQRCIWNQYCQTYKQQFYSDCSDPTQFNDNYNKNVCEALSSNISLNLNDYQYCEYFIDTKECKQQNTQIAEADNCGYSNQINIFRCMGDTLGLCYFKNFKCQPLIDNEYKKILISSLTCDQSNMQLCNQIITPGQACYKVTERKCMLLYTSFTDTCANLASKDMGIYSPNLCIRASDECFYDSDPSVLKCAAPADGDMFDCTQIGASQQLCLKKTKGACIFTQNFCKVFNDQSTSCEFRNKKACTLGIVNCLWNDTSNSCVMSVDLCPDTYSAGSNWTACNIGNDCYSGTDGCITDNTVTDLPCWLSQSQTLCEYQQTFCQWIDNKCLDKIYSCENAQTFNECIFHTTMNCVYDNNKCFEITDISNHSCDEFDYTSLNFCRNYLPLCVYIQNINNCQKINYFGQSKQRDTELNVYGCGSISATKNSCTLQRISSCTLNKDWYSDSCSFSDYFRSDCEYFTVDDGLPSILFCELLDQCRFGLTSLGEPFCHSSPLQCEKLSNVWCLKDIPDALCYLDADDVCKTFSEDIGYDAILTLKVNFKLCVHIGENDSTKQYYYQQSTHLCKYKNLELPLEIQVNDCNQLTDPKFYDIGSQSCLDFDQSLNLDQIYYCSQLNQVSCVQLKNDMFCVWVQEKNRCLDYDIQYADQECSTKNYQSCLISNDDCIWKSDEQNPCQKSSDVSACPDCPKSEKYCILQTQLWNGEQCYDYNGDLPLSFYRCDNLGLNENLCLNNTIDLFCYWDGNKCKQSNLKTQKCEDTVSKQTCLNIKTKKQICKWQNDSCINVANSQNCNDYLSLQNCRDSLISCEFNSAQQECQVQNENPQFCSNTLSYGACQKVEYQYCQWNQNQCSTWFRTRYSCQNIVNHWGCLNTVMYCKWDNNKCEDIENFDNEQPQMPCLDIPDNFNKVSCSKYSETSCRYDEQLKRCNINLTSEFTTSLETDQINFVQIRLTNQCDELTTKEDCIGSRIGYCEWNSNQCLDCQSNQSCTQNVCSNKSVLQCLSMTNLLCAWRNDQCVDWIVKQDIDLEQLTLVTEKCCSSIHREIKYNLEIKSCQPLNLYEDDCSTLGLSEYACLRLKNFQCTYKNGQCQTFDSGAKTSCDLYTKVTQYVCMNLQHLSCKYDFENHKCIQLDKNDDCNVMGLSVLGCTTIQSNPCYWNSEQNQCQDFIVNPGENQCDDFVKRNSLSCSLLNYHLDVCSFNIEKRTCHQKFNENSQCSFPGLNQLACSQLKMEPCIYKNNKCQKITNLYVSCAEMQLVNELACKLNMLDICSFDPIYHNCNFSLSQLPCNYQGINLNNCKNQEKCTWSYDITQCICQSEIISNKCQFEIDECKTKEICVYDNEIQMCKLKTCSNLSKCEGKVNGYVCYLNAEQKCQNAQKCEDIINLDKNLNCEEFLFDFSNCISLSNNCISSKNLKEICVNSDCSNTSCKLDNSICRPLQCSDYSESECYYFSNCSFINNKCQYVQSCSEIDDNVVCVSTTVQGKRCSWEMYGIFENTKHCTNTYCYLYMASPSLCNGNEINQYSCYMDQFLQCRQCEEIVDRCTCENSKGACIYSDGQCKSVLCQSFLNENDCVISNKCYWSSVDKVCRKSCKQLILEEDCDALSYECHWNPYQYKCEQGIEVIPDLSVKIDVQDIQSLILKVMVLVFIFQS